MLTLTTFRAIAISLLLLVIASCGGQSPQPQLPEPTTPEQQLQQLYNLARQSKFPVSEGYRIDAAELLLELNRLDQAESILVNIKSTRLPPELLARWVLVSSELALYRFDGAQALETLQQQQALLAGQNNLLQIRAAQLKAQALDLLGRPIDSARALIQASPLFSGTGVTINKEQIWQALMKAPMQQLQQQQSVSPQQIEGWLALAVLTKANQDDLDSQLAALQQWLQQWPTHPAAGNLPDELTLLSTMVTERPRKITLMLPLTGKNSAAARAIRDGMLAAYYATLQTTSYTPTIDVIDTARGEPFSKLYDAAVLNGADFIVGPLEKENVESLMRRGPPAVPTLALNYVQGNVQGNIQDIVHSNDQNSDRIGNPTGTQDNQQDIVTGQLQPAPELKTPLDPDGGSLIAPPGRNSADGSSFSEPSSALPNLYQFGLSAEDEARQAAHRAWEMGYRNSLIIAPDTAWGQRISGAFAQQWQALSGTLLEAQYFSQKKSYSNAIRELLNIDESGLRAQRIGRLIGTPVEAVARRRQDMDFIFLVATPKQARQIKPTLAFHFAGRIPVISTSHIYDGVLDPGKNRDLNDIIFCETPWLLEYHDHSIKNAIKKSWPNSADSLARLYALGVDAYRIIPRLKQLALIENSRVYGATGSLIMHNGRIKRHLLWAQMRNGRAVQIKELVSRERSLKNTFSKGIFVEKALATGKQIEKW